MTSDEFLHEAKKIVRATIPENIVITDVELEGPMVVVYTKNLDVFTDNKELIRELVQSIKRRVTIRPDASTLMDEDRARTEITHIIPPEAEVTDIYFWEETGEVTIEALSPGAAIGKQGTVLNEIKKRIGWSPRVIRTPPIPSKTIEEVRGYLRMVRDERKAWLKKVGRRINRLIEKEVEWVRITSLGGYREIGRSATLLTTKHSKVIVDCGVRFSNEDGSPYLNIPEVLPIDSIDAVVITHAHLDHSGLLPLLFKYGYEGPVYCTAPTRDLMSLLQLDYIKVAYGDAKRAPYDSGQIRDSVRYCIPLEYGDTTDITPDIRLTLQNAGHILGSAIAHFHIGEGDHNIAITGDIKYERTWLFNPANDRFPRLETLIIESTYGGYHDVQPSRSASCEQLRIILSETLEKKGKVLIPVFAVGRSQEVMLVIESLMRNKQVPEVPVFIDGMIWEATTIHTAHPEYLNSGLKSLIFQKGDNPFLSKIFNRVDTHDKRIEIAQSSEPCIILATSGMLNGGPVMEYFKELCTEQANTIVFVGFQAEGTFGRRVQKGWGELEFSLHGKPTVLQIKMRVETCDGFSGHSDREQLISYVYALYPKPERIVVCHGEDTKCTEFASTLYRRFGIETRAPLNLETIRLK